MLGEVLVDDHFQGQLGRRELFAEPAVGGRVGDQQIGMVGGVADGSQMVELELPDSEPGQNAGEWEYFTDVP
ncbi:hypothetical protein GCM10023238_38090 [Streptomyces heliomycini]